MPAAPDRRLVILAEGNFGFHHGKTAMGVIRFGTDKVVAVIDSTQAGRNVREWLGDSGPLRHPDRRRRSTTRSGSCRAPTRC